MDAYVLLGGSGRWNLIVDRKAVAGGHIPDASPRTVIGNQAKRFTAVTKRLGAGSRLDLKEVGLTEEDARNIADHANQQEASRLNDLARAFGNTRRYVDEGWRVVGQSDYPASGLYMERDGERIMVTYE